jgi:hypothetical protein
LADNVLKYQEELKAGSNDLIAEIGQQALEDAVEEATKLLTPPVAVAPPTESETPVTDTVATTDEPLPPYEEPAPVVPEPEPVPETSNPVYDYGDADNEPAPVVPQPDPTQGNLPSGVQVADAGTGTVSDSGSSPYTVPVGGVPIFAGTAGADKVRPPFGYDLMPQELNEKDANNNWLRPAGAYYDETQNAWFMPNKDVEQLQQDLLTPPVAPVTPAPVVPDPDPEFELFEPEPVTPEVLNAFNANYGGGDAAANIYNDLIASGQSPEVAQKYVQNLVNQFADKFKSPESRPEPVPVEPAPEDDEIPTIEITAPRVDPTSGTGFGDNIEDLFTTDSLGNVFKRMDDGTIELYRAADTPVKPEPELAPEEPITEMPPIEIVAPREPKEPAPEEPVTEMPPIEIVAPRDPVTPAPVTPAPVTPVTPKPVIPKPVTPTLPRPVTPTLPKPVTPQPAPQNNLLGLLALLEKPQQQATVQTPLADIKYYYDIMGNDILPPTPIQNQKPTFQYAEGGTIEDLIRILRS